MKQTRIQTMESIVNEASRLIKQQYKAETIFKLLRADSRFSFFGDYLVKTAVEHAYGE